MISFLKIPTELNLAHNHIAYVLATDLVATKYILVKLFVETEFGSNTYQAITTQITVPDTNRQVTVYVNELIKAKLAYDLPNFQTTSAVNCKQTCKKFYISTAELGVNEYVGNAVFTAETNRYYALLGEWRRYEFPIRTSLVPNNSNFLTRKAKELTISIRQKEWITILPPQNGTITLNFSVQFETTTETFSKTLTGTKFQPVHYDISFQAQNYQALNTGEQVQSISITYLGESRTYYVAQDYYLPSVVELYYLNSLGGWDSLLCYGQHTQSIDIQKQEYQKMQLFDYQNIDSTFDVYNLNQRTGGKLYSGYLSKVQFEQCLDVLKAKKVFARLNKTVFIPINLTNKKHELKNSLEYLKGLELDYEVAYNEIVLMEENNFTQLVTPPPPPPPVVRSSQALRFDGLGQHVDFDYTTDLDFCESIKPFTLFVDFYQTAGSKLIHNQKGSSGAYKGFYINTYDGAVEFAFHSFFSPKVVNYSMFNTRRKLAIVADTATMQWHCYIDGDLKGSFPYEFSTPEACGNMQLGGYFRDVIVQQFQGYIYELQVFNRALSAGEVATLQTGAVSTGKVALYEFKEGVGINVFPTVGTASGLLKNYTNEQRSYGTSNHWVDNDRNPIT